MINFGFKHDTVSAYEVSIAVVVTFILTLILYTLVLLLVVYCVYRCRGTNNTK